MTDRPQELPVFRAVIPASGPGYDADTVTVDLDQWFGHWQHGVDIRLVGGNSEEITTPGEEGETQRDFVRSVLVPGTRLILRTEVTRKDEPVQSFTRYVGTLWLRDEDLTIGDGDGDGDPVSLNEWLSWANVLAPWNGRSRPVPVPVGPIRPEAIGWLADHRDPAHAG
jgi:hypothetical protein